ncbi:hypothetical protein [Bifidobacterium magnum]|nr:hypothetical protein [Bifidobacterium magnum]
MSNEIVNPSEDVGDDYEFEELEPIGPDLPPATALNLINDEWSLFVRQYYESFRRSPQARKLRSRWEWNEFILSMAIMDKSIKRRSYDGLGPELRQRLNQYGNTPESKVKLKIEQPEANDMAAGIRGFAIVPVSQADFDERAGAVM